MGLKNVLVHVDNSKRCAARLEAAIRLARTHDAHLTGIYAIPHPYIPPYMTAGYIPAEFIEEQAGRAREDANRARDDFLEQTAHADIEAEWRVSEGYAAEVVGLNARYADLTVVGQSDPDNPDEYADVDLPAEVALSAGRPILVVPYIGIGKTLGKTVMVAWNGSREATRAVNDALPILERADKVSVIAVNPQKDSGAHGDIPSADISLHLARHGVKAEAAQTVSAELDVGAVILSRVADSGTDLVVMGAYGHSRMRELMLGGVTRDLLHHMTVPVLMSH